MEISKQISKKKRMEADLMLLSVTIFWGASYLLTDYALEELSPLNINVLRFIVSFVAIFAVLRKKLLPVSRETLKFAAITGFIAMITYMTSTLGVKYTSLSNAGFLCSLTVVFTPVLGYFFKNQKPEKRLILAVGLAFAGIGMMTLNGDMTSAFGDILCIICALSYAVLLLVTETAVCRAEVNPFQLGIYQVGFAGLYLLAISLPTETIKLPQSPKVWVSVLMLAFLCTGLAFLVQSLALQHTTAARAGIIFSLEPVFAALIAFFIAGEMLSLQGYLGAGLLMMSLFSMEIDPGAIKERRERRLLKETKRL